MRLKRFIDIPHIEKYFRIEEDGGIWSLRKQKYIRATFNTAGYLFVNLPVPSKDGSISSEYARSYAVHRLVATKYIGQCPQELETSHKDGIKTHNHYTNLEYTTHSKNILKSYREHGRKACDYMYHHLSLSYETKHKMAEAKKKPVLYVNGVTEVTYKSIEDAAQSLNTYRKKIYNCITHKTEFKDKNNPSMGGFLSFVNA